VFRHADDKAVAVAAAADPHSGHATAANVELHLNTATSAEPKEPKASSDRNHNHTAGTSDGAPLEGKSQPMRVATSTQLTTQPTQKSVSFHHEVPRESVNDEREL